MTTIPTLETERLLLRALVPADFEAYFELWRNEEVVRYTTGAASDRETTWARMLRSAGHWHHLGFGFFAVQEKASGTLIGEVGFLELRRAIVPTLEGTLETGWIISPEFQGKGYAAEAVAAALQWAAATFPAMPYTCIIDPDNHRSLKLADKLGFRKIAEGIYKDHPVLVLSRSAAGSQTVR